MLIADRSKVQDVKKVIDTLKAARVAQAEVYPAFTRPGAGMKPYVWGTVFRSN